MTKRHPRAKAGRSSWVYCLAIPTISRSARTGHLQEIRREVPSCDLFNGWLSAVSKTALRFGSRVEQHFCLTFISEMAKQTEGSLNTNSWGFSSLKNPQITHPVSLSLQSRLLRIFGHLSRAQLWYRCVCTGSHQRFYISKFALVQIRLSELWWVLCVIVNEIMKQGAFCKAWFMDSVQCWVRTGISPEQDLKALPTLLELFGTWWTRGWERKRTRCSKSTTRLLQEQDREVELYLWGRGTGPHCARLGWNWESGGNKDLFKLQ